jgi:hypothetical protein
MLCRFIDFNFSRLILIVYIKWFCYFKFSTNQWVSTGLHVEFMFFSTFLGDQLHRKYCTINEQYLYIPPGIHVGSIAILCSVINIVIFVTIDWLIFPHMWFHFNFLNFNVHSQLKLIQKSLRKNYQYIMKVCLFKFKTF